MTADIFDREGKTMLVQGVALDLENWGGDGWGGTFEGSPSVVQSLFRPQLVIKLRDGRTGRIVVRRMGPDGLAEFLGSGLYPSANQ